MNIINGISVNSGIVFGKIKYYHARPPVVLPGKCADSEAEIARYRAARNRAVERLGQLHQETARTMGEENALLFQIHQMMLEDLDFNEAVEGRILEGSNAEPALWETAQEFAELFSNMDDAYMQARAGDVTDIAVRVLDLLAGRSERSLASDTPVILAAEDLLPSETAQLKPENTLAIVTAKGSKTSHTAIFARSLGIPAVIALGEGLNATLDGMQVAVDAQSGALYVEPTPKQHEELQEKHAEQARAQTELRQYIGHPTKTAGGRHVMLYANIGSPDDLPAVLENDAEGIGLFRSEFLYLGRSDFPGEEEQFLAYRQVAQAMEGKRVIIRTLDIGADKQADYFRLPQEENPALGMRAIRICLTQPDIFITQLRALYRASAFGKIAIMFPMITSLDEVRRAKEAAQRAREQLQSEGIAFAPDVEIGIMVETPAAAILSDQIAPEVDFFSIGTNDLIQYTLACDRQNSSIDMFCDPHSEAVLRLMETTCKNAHAAGIWCGLCGELAADESLTARFLAMGIDELSVAPSFVLPLRKAIYEQQG